MTYYSGHKESNNLHRDIVILRVLRGAELISQSAFERNIQPAWQSLKLLTRRYLNSGQGNIWLCRLFRLPAFMEMRELPQWSQKSELGNKGGDV